MYDGFLSQMKDMHVGLTGDSQLCEYEQNVQYVYLFVSGMIPAVPVEMFAYLAVRHKK